MKKRVVYLDHNATTAPRREVVEAMLPYLRDRYGNPSSLYALGQEGRRALDEARQRVADLLRVQDPNEIVFTSGGTESINWAIKGVALAAREKGRHIVTTKIEHSAALNTCAYLESLGWHVTYVGVDWYGRVNPRHIEEAITDETALVSVMHANNEIGAIEPVVEIGAICRKKGVPFHIDAVQTVGKIPTRVDELNCDLLSLSGHKFYGPKGIGALYLRTGTRMHPLIHGGSHERRRRAGTENVPGIVGLGVACELAQKEMSQEEKHLRPLRDRLEQELLKLIECARVNGHPTERLYHTLNMSLECIEGEGLIVALDLEGIMVSSGSACSSGSTEPSHVLKAIGVPLELAKGSVRFSLGRENTAEDIEAAVRAVPKAVERLRSISPLWGDYKKGLRPSVIPQATV